MLKGVDLSHHKSDVNINAIACDFVITKATGGTGFVDKACDKIVQASINAGKKWGVYHYASDGYGATDATQEADWFVNNTQGYVGKGLLILDWEAGGNPHIGNPGWAKQWLDRVYARTGVKPIIYMNNSTVNSYNWSAVIAAGYGLWVAAWPDNNKIVPNYQMDPARDPSPAWDGKVGNVLWQFTSTGRLDGYGGNLDCNFFYGSREAWDAYARRADQPAPPTTTTTTTVVPPPTTTTTTEEPVPEPTTTTTTTTDNPPPSTTTTTTEVPTPPNPPVTVNIFIVFWRWVMVMLDKLRGK